MLQFLISSGASAVATVGKLKKYRDLELKRKQVFAGLAEGEDVPVEKEEKIKTREEKLKEKKTPRRGKVAKRFNPMMAS